MNEISWFFIGHMVCVSQWAAFLLVDRAYLGKGRVKHVGFWSVVLVAGMLAFSLIFQIGFFTLETVWYNVGYVLLSTLLFGGTLPQKLTAALINGTMCLLSENTVRYVVSWVTGTSLQVVWQRPGCLVTMTLTNLIVGVVVAYFSHQWKDERALESPQALVMSFFPGIVVVLNVVLMLSAKDEPADSLMVLLTLGLTVAVLLHMYIVQMFNQQMVRQQELHVQTALERERAEALMDSYTTQRRLTHEFTNHIEALTLLLQQGEYEEAKAYLATVTKIIAAHTTIMNTHNPLLDALLSKKYEEATRKGVMLYFDLPDLRAIPLEKTDLVMVVSNLLNNAIDAAAQADPPEVYFRMRKTEEELLLSVRNRGPGGSGPAGRSAPAQHQKGAGPRHRPVECDGCAPQVSGRVRHQLPGQMVPVHLFGAGAQNMTSSPAEYDILRENWVNICYNLGRNKAESQERRIAAGERSGSAERVHAAPQSVWRCRRPCLVKVLTKLLTVIGGLLFIETLPNAASSGIVVWERGVGAERQQR